jgi:TonB-linked SusC/RagA family outer membrane protein
MVAVAATALAAQNGTITGVVTDASSGLPLAAAQVFIPDLNLGVLSQQNGRYTLTNVPAGRRTVSVQRIGYPEASQAATVTAGQSVELNFRLTQSALQLDQLVVTGTPGGQERRAIGNTVATVSVEQVTQDAAISTMQDLLAGRTGGVQFTALSGNVGSGSPIQIRGTGSFTASRSQPLLVVDGVRVNNSTTAGPQLGNGGQVSVLDDFNPDDIESIEVIKGPAAAALYGTEASAGVIQIITKKGASGAPVFTAAIRQGGNYMPDPAGRLGTYYTCPTSNKAGSTQDGMIPCRTEDELVSYNMYEEANRYIREGYFPWPTKELFSTGYVQGYNLDVRGGTDAIRYFISANRDDETGFVWYNYDKTNRLRGNLDLILTDQFSFTLQTAYTDGTTRFEGATVSDGGLWQDLVWSNGFYLDRLNPFGQTNANGRNWSAPRLGGFQEHLPTDVAQTQAYRDYSRFTGSGTLSFNLAQKDYGNVRTEYSSRAVVGLDKGWDTNTNLYPKADQIVPDNMKQYVSVWGPVYAQTAKGEMTYSRPITTNTTFDAAVTQNLWYGNRMKFQTSVGAQYYIANSDIFTNTGSNFASTSAGTVNLLSPGETRNSYSYIENKSLGFFVQETMSWSDRIFLTGALRFDDNSTFGADAPSQKYPRLSGSWVVSDESFWSINALNSFRLRAAWGKSGRQPDAISGINTYAIIVAQNGGAGFRPSTVGNPMIEPEVSTELELGFEFAALNDRLSGEFTHYNRVNDNQLLSRQITPSLGIPEAVQQNLGRLDNWGWEASLNSHVYNRGSFTFDLDLGADHTDNKIISLREQVSTDNIRIGLPFPNNVVSNWVVSADWVDTGGNYANAFNQRIMAYCDSGVSLAPEGARQTQYGVMPGGEALPCDQILGRNIFVGRGFATYTFRVSPRLTFFDNRLSVFALAEGQYGRTNQASDKMWAHNYDAGIVSRLENDPVWVAGDRLTGTGNDIGKTFYNADFWKLREIGGRFSIPSSMARRFRASNASIAVSARNPVTLWVAQSEISGLKITDPEYGNPTVAGGGGSFYQTPPISSVTATLRLSF